MRNSGALGARAGSNCGSIWRNHTVAPLSRTNRGLPTARPAPNVGAKRSRGRPDEHRGAIAPLMAVWHYVVFQERAGPARLPRIDMRLIVGFGRLVSLRGIMIALLIGFD